LKKKKDKRFTGWGP